MPTVFVCARVSCKHLYQQGDNAMTVGKITNMAVRILIVMIIILKGAVHRPEGVKRQRDYQP